MSKKIHPTAIVDESVKIADNVEIGAFCVLQGDIEIDEGTKLENNVCIDGKNGHIKIGKNNHIFPFACIGSDPQDNKFVGEESSVSIGDNNIIREYCTINGGSNVGNVLADTKNITIVGNGCYLYISSHVAHDVYLEDRVTLTNCVGISGHVKIGHDTIVGGLSGVHQFVNIGHNVMIGGMCGIANDVPPYAIVLSTPSRVSGANLVGLKRAGMKPEDIKKISLFYKEIASNDIHLTDILSKYEDEESEYIRDIINFIKHGGKRGWLV